MMMVMIMGLMTSTTKVMKLVKSKWKGPNLEPGGLATRTASSSSSSLSSPSRNFWQAGKSAECAMSSYASAHIQTSTFRRTTERCGSSRLPKNAYRLVLEPFSSNELERMRKQSVLWSAVCANKHCTTCSSTRPVTTCCVIAMARKIRVSSEPWSFFFLQGTRVASSLWVMLVSPPHLPYPTAKSPGSASELQQWHCELDEEQSCSFVLFWPGLGWSWLISQRVVLFVWFCFILDPGVNVLFVWFLIDLSAPESCSRSPTFNHQMRNVCNLSPHPWISMDFLRYLWTILG